MIFRNAALIVCLVAASASATDTNAVPRIRRVLKAAKAGKAGKADKSIKSSKKSVRPQVDDDCISDADMAETIAAFAGTPPTITLEYNANGCAGAYGAAIGALNVAYGYNFGPVLFKPTLTSVPYTQRNTLAGALSYFIGTRCLLEVNSTACDGPCVFPDGNENGDIFNENGFGQNSPDGWEMPMQYNFNYLSGGTFCESSLAIGQICWEEVETDSTSCVDKTFSFKKGDASLNQNAAVITSHHSSSAVKDVGEGGTLTTCQNAGCADTGSYSTTICPPVDPCPVV